MHLVYSLSTLLCGGDGGMTTCISDVPKAL